MNSDPWPLLQTGDTVTRETFWQITPTGKAIFYYLAVVTILFFLHGVYTRFNRYTHGTDDWFDRLDNLPRRIVKAARTVLSNRAQFNRDIVAGTMHAFIMWGFLTLLIGTTILMIDMDGYQLLTALLTGESQSFFVGDFYLSYSLVMDAFGLLFVVGLGVAIWRRYGKRLNRLHGRHTGWEDDFLVWSLFFLGVGGYIVEGLRILGTGFPPFETVSFVGWFIADIFAFAGVSESLATRAYPIVWWSHALLAFGFIAAIPYAKPFHMFSSFANVVTRDPKAGVRLPGTPADFDADVGAESIDSFSWKQLLDQDACTNCGRCSAVCPAAASGRPLDPRDVILDLKGYRDAVDSGDDEVDIIADGGESVIDAQAMESCMACMACMDACPVDIEHLTSFTRLNRQLTDQGDLQPPIQDVFQNVMQKGNSFGEPQRTRADWTNKLDFEIPDARETSVDYLWYIGDYPSFDERNKQVARALAKILTAADASFGILYDDEQTAGNDIRRLGEELLYIDLAGHHVESFRDCEFDTIVCTDPHSYNTIKNEYPEIDFEEFADDPMMGFDVDERWNQNSQIDVRHWTQVIEELVVDGALEFSLSELDYTVTYHDPCHLGRYNGEYESPRELIRATGCSLHEMPRNRADSFCCGGGGGGVWMEHEEESKPSEERLREALEETAAGSDIEKFVVACPMCMTMYEDGRKTGGFEDAIEIVDISELILEALNSKTNGMSENKAPVP